MECAVALLPLQASGRASGVMDETSIGCGGTRNTAVFDTMPAGGVSPQIDAVPLVNHTRPDLTAATTASSTLASGQRGIARCFCPTFFGMVDGQNVPIEVGNKIGDLHTVFPVQSIQLARRQKGWGKSVQYCGGILHRFECIVGQRRLVNLRAPPRPGASIRARERQHIKALLTAIRHRIKQILAAKHFRQLRALRERADYRLYPSSVFVLTPRSNPLPEPGRSASGASATSVMRDFGSSLIVVNSGLLGSTVTLKACTKSSAARVTTMQ